MTGESAPDDHSLALQEDRIIRLFHVYVAYRNVPTVSLTSAGSTLRHRTHNEDP
jgi:hypothetical protein